MTVLYIRFLWHFPLRQQSWDFHWLILLFRCKSKSRGGRGKGLNRQSRFQSPPVFHRKVSSVAGVDVLFFTSLFNSFSPNQPVRPVVSNLSQISHFLKQDDRKVIKMQSQKGL